MTSRNGSRFETNYNEERPPTPSHRYPKGTSVDFKRYPHAGARIVVEYLASKVNGITVSDLRRLQISKRDIAEHRESIRDALLHVLREPPASNQPRIRGTAVGYLGELRIEDATGVLGGLVSSQSETPTIRGLAAEALWRIGGDACADYLRAAVDDPLSEVRDRVVRALGIIGRPDDVPLLAAVAAADSNPLVRRSANQAARALLPRSEGGALPDLPRRGRRTSNKSEPEDSIVRSIGRDGRAVQATHEHATTEGLGHPGADGGVDHIANTRTAAFAPGVARLGFTYEVETSPVSGALRARLVGAGPPSVATGSDIAAWSKPMTLDRYVTVDPSQLVPGRPLPIGDAVGRVGDETPVYVPNLEATPVITHVGPDVPVVWAKRAFAMTVAFVTPSRDEAVWLKLSVKYPKSGWQGRWFAITAAQRKAGSVRLAGFRCGAPGHVEVEATLYGSGGGASRATARFICFTANPHSVSVVPQTRGTNGEGPAHYSSGEDRFYCYARCTFVNGHSATMTVGPTVTCVVTDGGSHVATFNFSIGEWTVAAQSSRVINIYTYHGSSSDVYDVFEDFGDVRMDFTFQTSLGNVSDWNVWAAMARIELALNFVGNIDVTTRARFQDIAETEASAILEQQSLYISDTQRFLLPSDHADWNRYRDIEMDDNKASDCTAGSDEADDLRDDWSSPNDWLDVWIVESFSGPACSANVGGFSPVDGPTAKGGSSSGFVIQLAPINTTTQSGRDLMGIVIAHELGHFLGLEHSTTNNNFMEASVGTVNTDITHGQYVDMADHGFVERHLP